MNPKTWFYIGYNPVGKIRQNMQSQQHRGTRGFTRQYGQSSEKAMAPHSSTLAWKIPWTEEPGGLQSMGSLRVGHDWATSLSLLCIGEGNGNSLQCSCLENPRGGRAWWAAVHGVAQSWTRLKQLSSSSSSMVSHQLLRWLSSRESTCQCRRCKFNLWSGKIP